MKKQYWLRLAVSLALFVSTVACGGGSSSGSSGSGDNGGGGGGSQLQITTNSLLRGTLQGSAYLITLTATGGQGSLKWSMGPISATASYVDGLSIDPNTGVVSGTVNFAGTCGFTATVTDSASHTASKSFTITATTALTAPSSKAATISAYVDIFPIFLGYGGGVEPLTFSVTGGSLPPGMRFDPSNGNILGSATTPGVYSATFTITDSYSTPEVVSEQVVITVQRPALQVTSSLPSRIPINQSFSSNVVPIGGTPPYSFSLLSGSVPGLSGPDPGSGVVSGVPTTAGSWVLKVKVTDSSSPAQSATQNYGITVAAPLGRNDTVQTATTVGNGSWEASISPYIDPPDKAPYAGDGDYYKLVSLAGSTVHVETYAKRSNPNNPLDTVLEIVDANGVRLSTCRQPGGADFTSSCINDDMSSTSQDSSIDIQVPGDPSTATAIYAHVLDWRGDARPDMRYGLIVNGIVAPLDVKTASLAPAARGLSYSQQIVSENGNGATTWTVQSGTLPPGLTLSSTGVISGSATTDGSYSFTVQAADSSTPPQTASKQFTINVVEPVKITSSATFPDACLNQPYSYTLTTSGGIPPIYWTFISNSWVPVNLNQSTGVFSGTPGVVGTFTGSLGAGDDTGHFDSQNVSLTVKNCP